MKRNATSVLPLARELRERVEGYAVITSQCIGRNRTKHISTYLLFLEEAKYLSLVLVSHYTMSV